MRIISISIPEEEYNKINNFCLKNKINRSSFIRESVLKIINNKSKGKKWTTILKKIESIL